MTIFVEVIISLSLLKGVILLKSWTLNKTKPCSKVSAWKNISSREFERQSDLIKTFTESFIRTANNAYRNHGQVPKE